MNKSPYRLQMPQTVPIGWSHTGSALTRTVERKDFVDALALVLEIGRLAEAVDHHPDIDIRFRTVHLTLCTHSAGHTVTSKDFVLAQQINDLAEDTLRLTADELRRRFHALTPLSS
jgi:4a-hydroxytetrahydrobiopterin dehydratase